VVRKWQVEVREGVAGGCMPLHNGAGARGNSNPEKAHAKLAERPQPRGHITMEALV